MDIISLPVIDLKQASDPAYRVSIANKLFHALETIGFLYIDNVPGYDEEELIKWCQWFFALPNETKYKLHRRFWNPDNKNIYRGSFPVQDAGTSVKEGFEIGLNSKTKSEKNVMFSEYNVWPTDASGHEEFKAYMVSYFDALFNAGLEICRLVCLGCGLEENWLDSTFIPDTLSTLRLLHYPQNHDSNNHDGDVRLCCSEHSDSGFITLLSTLGFPGLQLKLGSGQWVDVPKRPNSLVMNIGDMLSIMTGNCLKATQHRVIDPGVDRYSVPFFFEPSYEAEIGYTFLGFPSQTIEKKQYGDWLQGKILEFQEYRYLGQKKNCTV
ncbi:hypothetical protein LOTGIDRAFT_227971 [Lottia gigantea]|uniref:Fe2OG dioxygenase domain-containing protein n=1 Tax=Lottia gigantea TaxID=225164 RepID=V4BCI0_LOTGI|nr:hypothetical protein LOTGIDRAFT_227971 [Lottia gigantea]ESP05341.1 hypothetical protein LOTGIDRAFT_227971 [Lottia gigantea]